MVEVDHCHAEDGLLHLLVPFVVLVHHFLQQQRLPLQLLLAGRNEDVLGGLGGEGVLGWDGVGLERHLYFFEQVVRNMMVGVVLKIGLVFVVGLEVDLVILQHS